MSQKNDDENSRSAQKYNFASFFAQGEQAESSKQEINNYGSNIMAIATEKGVPFLPSKGYEKTEKLGRGAYGGVYKFVKDSETIAVKFLENKSLLSNPTELERFINEARMLIGIQNSNLVKIHGLINYNGNIGIAMEYVEGKSMETLPLPIQYIDAVAYIMEITKGLICLAEKKIVHRDLKPANIMITKDNHIKIIDFGIIKNFDESNLTQKGLTQNGKHLGTLNYMSPEQLSESENSKNSVDSQSDIWALGVIFYEMLTGKKPFIPDTDSLSPMTTGMNVLHMFEKIEEAAPIDPSKINPKISIQISNIVMKCLKKEKNDRYKPSELYQALANAHREIYILSQLEKSLSSPKQFWLLLEEPDISNEIGKYLDKLDNGKKDQAKKMLVSILENEVAWVDKEIEKLPGIEHKEAVAIMLCRIGNGFSNAWNTLIDYETLCYLAKEYFSSGSCGFEILKKIIFLNIFQAIQSGNVNFNICNHIFRVWENRSLSMGIRVGAFLILWNCGRCFRFIPLFFGRFAYDYITFPLYDTLLNSFNMPVHNFIKMNQYQSIEDAKIKMEKSIHNCRGFGFGIHFYNLQLKKILISLNEKISIICHNIIQDKNCPLDIVVKLIFPELPNFLKNMLNALELTEEKKYILLLEMFQEIVDIVEDDWIYQFNETINQILQKIQKQREQKKWKKKVNIYELINQIFPGSMALKLKAANKILHSQAIDDKLLTQAQELLNDKLFYQQKLPDEVWQDYLLLSLRIKAYQKLNEAQTRLAQGSLSEAEAILNDVIFLGPILPRQKNMYLQLKIALVQKPGFIGKLWCFINRKEIHENYQRAETDYDTRQQGNSDLKSIYQELLQEHQRKCRLLEEECQKQEYTIKERLLASGFSAGKLHQFMPRGQQLVICQKLLDTGITGEQIEAYLSRGISWIRLKKTLASGISSKLALNKVISGGGILKKFKYGPYLLTAYGIIYDTKENLEWLIGNDKNCVTSIDSKQYGVGWRMPTKKEFSSFRKNFRNETLSFREDINCFVVRSENVCSEI